MTTIMMLFLLTGLFFSLLYKAEPADSPAHFFDLTNSCAMRGFWCIVVVLVHTPEAYQNRIQDMAGSFAFVGVTFFFLTSAYGLSLSRSKTGFVFWKKRLPALLIPMYAANVIRAAADAVTGYGVTLHRFILINRWVLLLLLCYLIFWLIHSLSGIREQQKDFAICLLITVLSLLLYYFNRKGIYGMARWPFEVYGFAWGVLLARYRETFLRKVSQKRWLPCCLILCFVSGILGIAYLKYKYIVFFGEYLLKVVLGFVILAFLFTLHVRFSIGNQANLFLGKISYEIYLLHGAAFELLLFFAPDLNSGLFVAAGVLLSILIAWAAEAISRPVIRLIKKYLHV